MKKTHNKAIKVLADILVLGVLLICVSKVTFAATSQAVTATVTLQNVSVSVTDGSVNYGTLAVNTTKTTLSGGLNDQQTATNTGNVAEDFSIRGQNSADWTLDSSNATAEHYVEKFCIATCGTEGSPGAGFTALTTPGYAALGAGNFPPTTGSQTFDLLLITPSSSTHFASESVDVTVLAAAH